MGLEGEEEQRRTCPAQKARPVPVTIKTQSEFSSSNQSRTCRSARSGQSAQPDSKGGAAGEEGESAPCGCRPRERQSWR